MSKLSVVAVLVLGCLMGPWCSHEASASKTTFPRYYADSTADFPFFILLRADGTYSLHLANTDPLGGVYDIFGNRIIFHVQNQGDISAVYTGQEIRLPQGGGIDHFRLMPLPSIPAAFRGAWKPKFGDKNQTFIVSADGTCTINRSSGPPQIGMCRIRLRSGQHHALGNGRFMDLPPKYSVDCVFVGCVIGGSIKVKPNPPAQPRTYELLMVQQNIPPNQMLPYDYVKPYTAVSAPVATRQPKSGADTFGQNGVGD